MTAAELILIAVVAIVVFGPSKLPTLARHLALIVRYATRCKQQIMQLWQSQLHELQLQDNLKKAAQADEVYQQKQQQDEAISTTENNQSHAL